jgi:hypothetical protein
MFFMVHEQGRWWAVADQFSGMPGGAEVGRSAAKE